MTASDDVDSEAADELNRKCIYKLIIINRPAQDISYSPHDGVRVV